MTQQQQHIADTTGSGSVLMTADELRTYPERELCACAHPRGLHSSGLYELRRCRGRNGSELARCDCRVFRATGMRLPTALDGITRNPVRTDIDVMHQQLTETLPKMEALINDRADRAERQGINLRANMSDEDHARLAKAAKAAQTAPMTGADTITIELCSSVDDATASSPSHKYDSSVVGDGLRWAQQDELNAANARVIAKMQLQLNTLQDAAARPPTPPTDDADLREILNALLSTDTNIMGSIDNLAKTISRQERAIADLRKMAEHPLHVGVIGSDNYIESQFALSQVGIGSDVSAAAAPSSPNIVEGVGWVSCANRLPTPYQLYLVWIRSQRLHYTALWHSGHHMWLLTGGEELQGVTHWMLLPPPPAATTPAPPFAWQYTKADDDRCLCGGVGCNSCEPQGRG